MRVRVCDRVNIYRGKKQSHSTNLSDSYDAISERERSQILRESRRNDDRKSWAWGDKAGGENWGTGLTHSDASSSIQNVSKPVCVLLRCNGFCAFLGLFCFTISVRGGRGTTLATIITDITDKTFQKFSRPLFHATFRRGISWCPPFRLNIPASYRTEANFPHHLPVPFIR